MWYKNVIIIILLSITFVILFQLISYLFETQIEPLDYNELSSPSTEIIVGSVYPKSNMIDASNIQMRLDRLTDIFNRLEKLKTFIYSKKQLLNLTHEFKEYEDDMKYDKYKNKSSEVYDIDISNEPFNQTIHVYVPIGSKGIPGIKGGKGIKGPRGETGDIGPVGFCGLSIC